MARGRKRGSRNRGYFYRTGRGWCASRGKSAVMLRDEHGEFYRDRNTPQETLKAAYVRYLASQEHPVEVAARDEVTILDTCRLYLDHCKATGAASTYQARSDSLFDFCFGLPPGLRGRSTPSAKEIGARRIHAGYGHYLVDDLKPLHVDQWLASHPSWKGCRRTKVQAVKRALNYGVNAGFLSRNQIKGYKVSKPRMRMTYLTPEQEGACYRYSNSAFSTAIKVCIRTGARFGVEFAKLTAKHVRLTDKGMEWRFSADEAKTRKLRIIRIPNTEPEAKEIIAIVTRQMERFPDGPLFRNKHGEPWTRPSLSGNFNRLKHRLKRKGIKLDEDACMYSCRHTYAKRVLSGYWTGKPSTIERLAELMGNTREVCWEHYASWCDAYTDPLWESA